tara:strand:+ start:1150 stop:1446 length:297 start_codon:yes stop_codon:yes gene_type:complete
MSPYRSRLEVAKKGYIATEGVGECGVRFWWCVAQVGHSYTNMSVENLRVLFPALKKQATEGKDWAYVIGHVTQFFLVPTIVCQFAVVFKHRQESWHGG